MDFVNGWIKFSKSNFDLLDLINKFAYKVEIFKF